MFRWVVQWPYLVAQAVTEVSMMLLRIWLRRGSGDPLNYGTPLSWPLKLALPSLPSDLGLA